MKTGKRLLSLLLALTMVLSLMGNLSVAAFADDEPQSTEIVSNNGENDPADPDKDSTPADNGDDANKGDDANNGDDANKGGDENKDEPQQQEGDENNGDEAPANDVPVPTRKAGYPATTSDTVQTGTAYLLDDLQAGKIFEAAEGQSRLTYKNYYYQRSTDGGNTWGSMTDFSEAIFGMTTIQVTELTAGTYVYRFYASHDGVNFSKDTWTLTLTVEDAPTLEFSFYVGKDYNGNYPVIKLYNVDKDDDGNEVLGDEIENVFLYSNFTSTPAEGEDEYDPAMGKLEKNYQMFYAKLEAGRYAYRAFGKNANTGDYDVALGGMTLNLPTDKNVDGGAGGGGAVYLQCVSFYTTSKKTNNTYFAADEYHVRVDCPIMGCSTTMGDPYNKGNYAYYPTMLYAGGNACLYNSYAYPDVEGYIFTQAINQTFQPSYSANTKSMEIKTAVTLTVTVPADATFGLYFQWNNFNTTEVAPDGEEDVPYADRWTVKGDTKTATYQISKGNGNYTWRLSDEDHVTKAGWLNNASNDVAMTFTAATATDRVSHDFSKLGTQTSKRDEADLQVNLDPSGFEAITGTTRVRAYRHWQLINSDSGNIMVEPDFHWNVLRGDADYETVNGGNTTANWADITPGASDSIITVYYDSVDTSTGNPFNGKFTTGSHGGVYPATNPERVGVMVVGGTGVTHGTADAKVKFNMASGATTTRSLDWDYNYDTWFYEAKETNPTLDFTVTATGGVDVEYAFVTTDNSMNSKISTDFTSVSPDGNGNYAVPLAAFNKSGNGMGGTVIIRMTDDTGVSYRLVRVAKVTITTENVSNPGEDIMPGDQVKLTFKGMYRSVNKISGVFNPTTFKPTYYAGDTKFEGTLGQYQKMDNATVTVTIPEDVTFADGAATTEYTFTNGYTFGSMYSAANPFAFLYTMTDTGVGTNFNAVTVNYYINHYADAVITVHQKATYIVKLNITDENGKAVDGVTVAMLDRNGKAVAANEDGTFTLGYGSYSYTLTKSGNVTTRGSFVLNSSSADNVKDGILTFAITMPNAGANPWDGTTKTEPTKDDNGVYQIGTAAELAWFAANGGSASAKLTADIDLAGFDWTPMKNFYGTFDGDGHMVKNLYINSSSYPVGIFGYVKTGAKVTNLGVSGNVTCTASSNAQAGGIAGFLEDNATIENCYSSVNVSSMQHGGGIAGYTDTAAIIKNCYASGKITTTSTKESYLGGIAASYYNRFAGAYLTNCYSIATVTGGNSTYVGGLSPIPDEGHYIDNCFYLEGTVTKTGSTSGITGLGTAKTLDEMKEAIKANEHPFNKQMLADLGEPMKEWDGTTTTEPKKDANGTYQIGTAAELAWFAKAVSDGQYALNAVLTADIDLENNPWTPIGNNTAATTTGDVMYKGVFDGQGHVVKNLYINNTDNKQGLFSYVGGTIRNLGVTGSITTTGKFVGGIVGYLSSGKVENCYSDVTISAAQNAGGIVGGAHNGTTISYCYNAGDVTVSGGRVGGIIACAAAGPVINSATMDNCYNIGSVSGTSFVGGVSCVSKAGSYGANVYYLDTCITATNYGKGTAKTEAQMLKLLGAADGDTLQTALFNKWVGQVAAADEAAVKAVIDAINAIPQPVALTSKAKIIAAEKLYNALTAAQQSRVDNTQKLLDARAELDRLEAEQAAADKAAADAVIAKINAIGDVTLEKETAIKEARAAYDGLSTVQKNLVKNDGAYDTLEAAEATLKQLKADKEQADAVIGWINGLNDPITLAEEQGVRNIRARYDSLTAAQKALVTNIEKLEKAEKQLEALKAAIADTESKIDAIGNVELTTACKAKIDAARDAYDALTKEQQAKVSNYATLTAAEDKYQELADKDAADKATAKNVDDLIDAIGKVELSDACKTKIDDARKAYNALTEEQKALVSKLDALTAAEAEYQRLLDKDAADKKAAKSVDDLIDAIGKVELTTDSKAKIDAARAAYDALSDDQKAFVSKLETLTAAETEYKRLLDKDAADKAAAKSVDDLIDAIGDVELTDDCKAAIDAARAAYDALSDDQKAFVSKLDTLTTAEAAYKKLADDKAAVDDVIEKIDAIGKVTLTGSCKEKIDAARAAYDALPDELKELVTNYETLTKAERRYEQLKNKANSSSSDADSKTDSKTDGKTDGKDVKSGNTGDNSHLTLWMGGVVVSAAALILLAKKRRQDA